VFFCNKIAEAEAAGSVSERKWLVMHMHVQLKLDEVWAGSCMLSLCFVLSAVVVGTWDNLN
jgi:hypothetical protein